jgi:hypothetical protein
MMRIAIESDLFEPGWRCVNGHARCNGCVDEPLTEASLERLCQQLSALPYKVSITPTHAVFKLPPKRFELSSRLVCAWPDKPGYALLFALAYDEVEVAYYCRSKECEYLCELFSFANMALAEDMLHDGMTIEQVVENLEGRRSNAK